MSVLVFKMLLLRELIF